MEPSTPINQEQKRQLVLNEPENYFMPEIHFNALKSRTKDCFLYDLTEKVEPKSKKATPLFPGKKLDIHNEDDLIGEFFSVVVTKTFNIKLHRHSDLVWVWQEGFLLHQQAIAELANELGYPDKQAMAKACVPSDKEEEFKGQLVHFVRKRIKKTNS